ncbi:MAG: hypothetical protein COA32_17045 [Fluviicola sp.]|nr:MAG: hypothetical protein COA32_17045 [Fluviicola sp.]
MLDFFKNIDFDSISTWLKNSFNPLMLIIGCSLGEKTKRWFSVPFYFRLSKRALNWTFDTIVTFIEDQYKSIVKKAINYALSDPSKAYDRLRFILPFFVYSKRRREEILLTITLSLGLVSVLDLIIGNNEE